MAQFQEQDVKQAQQECLLRISRVREQLEHLESLVRGAEKQRLPLFREPMHKSCFKFHVAVRNLRHSLSDLLNAMMPK